MRPEVHIADIAVELQRQNLLPAIVFRSSRNQCDVDVQSAGASGDMFLSATMQRELHAAIREILVRYEMDEDLITTHPQYNALLSTGVGAHHAGQLLMWRLLLEELMASGYLRVLIATGTVAAGVDFPARTVVITAHSRRGAEGFSPLTSAEFQQMAGRAGRRGKDTVGFCLAAPAPFCDARTLLRISKQPPEPLVSSYFPGPSTVLNLLRYRNVDDLRYTVARSLASFYDRREARRLLEESDGLLAQLPSALRAYALRDEVEGEDSDSNESGEGDARMSRDQKKHVKRIRRERRQARELERRQADMLERALSGLRELGYLDGTNLSEKGHWAANLCTSIVLELGEFIEMKLFEDASAERLAALVGSLCGDQHRQYLETKNYPVTQADLSKMVPVLKRICSFGMPGLPTERHVLPAAAHTVLVWMHSESWQEFRGLLALSGVAEGDAARLITQTAEQLNQLTRLAESHQQLVFRAEEAKRRILRPPLSEGINLDTL